MNDIIVDGPHGPLTVRVYSPTIPKGPGLVWMHGGGFTGGDIDMPEADSSARAFAALGIAVVSVDYMLADTSPGPDDVRRPSYPRALDEVEAAFRWASTAGITSGRWAIGGASAGGNLAAGAALRMSHGDGTAPGVVALAYPTLHPVQATPDAALRAALDADPAADTFGPERVRQMYEDYIGGPIDDIDVYAAPGNASPSELADFPATVMVTGDVDELRVSGEAFTATLRTAGIEVDTTVQRGTRHGYLNLPGDPDASASIERLARRILAP